MQHHPRVPGFVGYMSFIFRGANKGLAFLVVGIFFGSVAWAGDLDTIGVTLLRHVDNTLQGSGVRLVQVEAPSSAATPPPFEVNPAYVGQPVSLFSYLSSSGTATTFPNALGAESYHADGVGVNLYSFTNGVAPQLSHVDNYEAGYFYNNIVVPASTAIAAKIANQSYIFTGLSSSQETSVNQAFDTYTARNGTLFISGVGNGGTTPVSAPSTCYNGIGVGVFNAPSSFGPTADGRCKPDLTAPGGETSFSTPYVSGSAVVLVQAATRGDGGLNTTSASDARTLKALLLNGAVKPAGWTNSPIHPLDARYGAGMVNVFNAWKGLAGGQHSSIESTSVAPGNPHPPGSNPGNESSLTGWDFIGISNHQVGGVYQQQINHYYLNLNSLAGSSAFTATLVWNRQSAQSVLNDLNLFLYNTANGSLIAASTSTVDNVEQIFIPALPKGRYDLQVQKNPAGLVSVSEAYALAYNVSNVGLSIARTNGAVVLSWPLYPAGSSLQSASSLAPPIQWTTVSSPVTLTGNSNVVVVPSTSGVQYFRLEMP